MKLRLYCNSLRFRLSPADVAQLDSTGSIAEKTSFAPRQSFTYSLHKRPDIQGIHADLRPGAISVELPADVVRDWRQSAAVGLHHLQSLDAENSLEILIEKDFECLEGKVENAGEALYPNPGKSCPAPPAVARR